MKKIILAGASTLALVAFAGSASAQQISVDVSVLPLLQTVQADTDGLGGLYINSAINNQQVNGSVNIDTDGLLGPLNASRVDANLSASVAGAASGANVNLPTANATGIGIGLSGAGELDLDIRGTTIASTDVIKTTAIGAVNTGVTSLAALERSTSSDFSRNETNAGDLAFSSSAANSASGTSRTEASAAAAATSLLIDGATSTLQNNIVENTASGPAAVVAANYAVNNAIVDGSVRLTGATAVAIDGTASTAIGAVNTGTITNGLPGSITIVAGDTSSTRTNNNNTTTTGGSGSTGGAGSNP